MTWTLDGAMYSITKQSVITEMALKAGVDHKIPPYDEIYALSHDDLDLCLLEECVDPHITSCTSRLDKTRAISMIRFLMNLFSTT